jgi:hypothetical protein
MTTVEERIQILKMVEKGQVSAAEAVELLAVLDRASEGVPVEAHASRAHAPGRMRVVVSDLGTGQRKVDISLPWGLVSVGMTMGARFTPPDVDLDLESIMAAVQAGTEGKVLEVVDEDEGERVEIFVD